jgi:phytoene dehydrogenase-like protein
MGLLCTDGVAMASAKDLEGWLKLAGLTGNPPFVRELLRATFWTPPHPSYVEVNAETIPYMQVYKERLPEVWTPEMLKWTQFDLMDEYIETEPFKTFLALVAWWSGAAAHFDGMAIPAFESVIAGVLYTIGTVPMGGQHGYYHALFRCAVAHGAVFRTCCPVDEIIVRHGRAVGVRLRDDAAWGDKEIWADKAVISATDIYHTFNDLIGPRYVDAGLMQQVNDLSLKGGTMYVNHFLTSKPLRYRPKFKGGEETGVCYPMDSRDIYYEHAMDCMGKQGNPTMSPERYPWIVAGSPRIFSDEFHPQCTRPNRYLNCSITAYVPPPEYHVEGPDAMNKAKDKLDAYMRQAVSSVFENLEDDLVEHWSITPWEQEFRNTGLIGGTWCTIRQCQDQWWSKRPLPELARYRVSGIDGLYLCHQSSAHPGGLCLMAVAYNVMHILIEDGIAEPGDWWYPSPWYIPERGKISAVPRSK